MPESSAAASGGVMRPEEEANMEMQVDPMAVFIASSSSTRKRAATQSDGLKESVEDTPDRTSSEDEHTRAVHADPGLPPMVPIKSAAKAAVKQPPKMPGHEAATAAGTQTTGLEAERPTVKTPKLQSAGLKSKMKTKGTADKKAAAKPLRVDRKRKRKATAESESAGISQSAAQMLFQCTCQLLRSQALQYDVQAREMEDRNAAQAREIELWEKRVRGLKRELQEYADEADEQLTESVGMAVDEADPSAAARGAEERNKLSTAVVSTPAAALGAGTTKDGSLPPEVAAAEAKVLEELRKRTQKVNEFCRSVPGFIESLDESHL
ncbi:hypothetical protein PF005_g25905 [Phytophthora fragariae]|uniref:Uncharacterized protein n=1 Tax=Phytophthora fragariae TaxID=53985 RepID=A0A6A3HZ72_9STRA|nr:hypothetical protein PF003_g35856 [Phytophthora fragariae]KAE8929829.1 hypothetical protein PF009_g20069 [Phytophthora fragariae]KAE8974767.1 hypothetical protein PF011_g24742 [Phytophthora fragariae]KAE9090615.1 hypothetical protein PF007_g19178 [Phytophthora fragariae]KAE9120749.1 hypothetical protein PF006_g18061 [Phytophthora fragariae]